MDQEGPRSPSDDAARSSSKLEIGGHLEEGASLGVGGGYFGILREFLHILGSPLLGGQILPQSLQELLVLRKLLFGIVLDPPCCQDQFFILLHEGIQPGGDSLDAPLYVGVEQRVL